MPTTTPQRISPLKHTTSEDYLASMARLQHHLRTHLDEASPPSTLARIAGMSTYHFHRVFRGMFGESVAEHVRRLRLERAASRLRFSQDTILTVAVEAGYQSHEAFTRAFCAHFELTPSAWRCTPSARVERAMHQPNLPVSPPCPELITLPTQWVVGIRSVGSYLDIPDAFHMLVGWAQRTHRPIGPLRGLFLDDPEITPLDKLRAEACMEVNEPVEVSGELTSFSIPSGVYAMLVHQGPYTNLARTYLALIGQWLPTSGYQLAPEPVLERYLNSPMDTPPAQLLTQVCVRLATS